MNTLELLEIEDQYDVGMPAVDGEYVPGPWKGESRTDLKPLHITQPEGASFTVDGTELRWQNWSMRLGFNYREGPVIYQVAYDDHGTRRDIAYRMSFAEMVVPYRDPTFDHYRRTAYDIGEWGLGYMTTSLELGCDCLGEIRLRRRGAARLPRASRTRSRTRSACTRRTTPCSGSTSTASPVPRCAGSAAWWSPATSPSRTTSTSSTGASTRTATSSARYARPASWSPPRMPRARPRRPTAPSSTSAPTRRSTSTSWSPASTWTSTVRRTPSWRSTRSHRPVSDDNPYGLALVTDVHPGHAPRPSAARDFNWDTQRGWKVVNPDKLNRHGTPVAYKLVPGAAFPAMMDPATPQYLRAPVIGHTLWVTRHDDDERWPCGQVPDAVRPSTPG